MNTRDTIKTVQIAGWLGSGKTTLIVALAKELAKQGSRVAILVNEVGAIPVDGKVVQEHGLTVKDIGGGCICCEVAGNVLRTIQLLSQEVSPDVVIIEPSGIAVPHAINETVKAGTRDSALSLGPTIVLFDTARKEKIMSYETLKRLVTVQLEDADLIALSKADMVSEESLLAAGEAVHLINPQARIIRLSTHTGEGLDKIVKEIRVGEGTQ